MKPIVGCNIILVNRVPETDEFLAILKLVACVGRLPWVKVEPIIGRTLLNLTENAVMELLIEVCLGSFTFINYCLVALLVLQTALIEAIESLPWELARDLVAKFNNVDASRLCASLWQAWRLDNGDLPVAKTGKSNGSEVNHPH